MILLDTDHLSVAAFPDGARGQSLLSRLQVSLDKEIGTTIVTAAEQVKGWLATISRERLARRQVYGYRRLLECLNLLARWTLIPFDDPAADEFENLRHTSVRRLNSMDLKITSIALTRGALLLSANLRDFRQVPGLRVENWMD